MVVGTPVMITKTDGFWDIEKFIDNKDLFFVSDNDVDLWKEKLQLFCQQQTYVRCQL